MAEPPVQIDLVLHKAGSGDAHHAARSPFALAVAPATNAASLSALIKRRDEIEQCLINEGQLTPEELRAYGEEIARVLLADKVGVLYAASPKQQGVRITVCADDASLKSIPWEYLFWPDVSAAPHRSRTLCRLTPVAGERIDPVVLGSEDLVVLLAVSNPTNLPIVDWQDTKATIEDLFSAHHGGRIVFEVMEAATPQDVRAAVKKHNPHIVHFIGHGRPDGLMFTKRASDKSTLVPSSQLHSVFGGDRVRLLILSACDTGKNTDAVAPLANLAEQLVQAGICAVVANQMPISLSSVAIFCGDLYAELLNSGNIDLAVNQGRIAVGVEFEGKKRAALEWGVPILYRRPGCDMLFQTTAGP